MKKTAGGGSWVAWGCWGGEGPGGEEAPAGASTAAAVGKQIALLREQTLLQQCGNTDSAPEGSIHYCGSEEIQKRLLRERRLLRR